ncbi:MAG: DUF2064 domain-containing protein [Candidatus Aminicenantes bacterium]|nr:DUF2064 domain-containing protein [Candidatus Aminicenantes bacterium]
MPRLKLIIFTRLPEPGTVKTRLIPALGEKGAAQAHREMTAQTLGVARALFAKNIRCIEVCVAGGDDSALSGWLGNDLKYTRQTGRDLGERMAAAFQRNFQAGYHRIVLVGTDCPQLGLIHLEKAFSLLKNHDMVIGPARDGGYYLLGLRRMVPDLFQTIAWGTDTVFSQTQQSAQKAGLNVAELDCLVDVDTPEDLPVYENVRRGFLSVVIPALNEGSNIQATLEHVGKSDDIEVIVADGGSRDRTVSLAKSWGARIVSAKPNRGLQQNRGAEAAQGNILLFLHADTRLPSDYAQRIRESLADPQIQGGYFRLKFFPSSRRLRLKEKMIAFRAQTFGHPYGDQAYFVRAAVFRHMGGFTEIPLMEDVEFIRRLRRLGRLVYIKTPVKTSARRFLRYGQLRATLRNKLTFLGFRFGVSPERLAKFYYKGSSQDENSAGLK